MSITWRFFLLSVLALGPFLSSAENAIPIPEITNLSDIVKSLKAQSFKGKKFSRKIKVAVLDNGFNGWEAEKGKSLPASTEYHPGEASRADDRKETSFHGLLMARLLAQIVGKSGAEADYELHLFNAYGWTKFSDAVKQVAAGGFDVVLYSVVWDFGGNGDGKGFMNAAVNKALESGVIWINASGDFGRLTRLAPVDGKQDGTSEWVVFKTAKGKTADGVALDCKLPAGKKCNLRLHLAWNDFKEDANAGTDKDLDLFIYDKSGKLIASREQNQKLAADDDEKTSILPRELLEKDIEPGRYNVRVKIKSKNFSASQDQLRLTATGLGIELSEPSTDETLVPPADNPGVIVIGASDFPNTSKSTKLSLPAVFFKSFVLLKDGVGISGTSTSAAMAAAVTVLHLGTGVEKSKEAVTAKLKEISRKSSEVPVAPPSVDDKPAVKPRPSPGAGTARPRSPRPGPAAGDQRLHLPQRAPSAPPPGYYRQPGVQAGVPVLPPAAGGAPVPPRVPSAYFGPKHGVQPCQWMRLPYGYPLADDILVRGGAVSVLMAGRPVISVNYDFSAAIGVFAGPYEGLVVTPQGVRVIGLEAINNGLPPGWYEVISAGIPTCR